MKVTITIEDKPAGGTSVRMVFDPPIKDSKTKLTEAGMIAFDLVASLGKVTKEKP